MAASEEQSARGIPEPTFTIEQREAIISVAWLPGERIVTGSSDSIARIWDLTTGMQVGSSMVHKSRIRDIVTTQDGRIISCCPRLQHLQVRNADTQEPVDGPWLNEHIHGPADRIFLSKTEQLLASCHSEWIVFWDMVETMRVRSHIRVGAGPEGVYTTAGSFSPDGMRFAVAFFGGPLVVFDVESASGERIYGPFSDSQSARRDMINDIVWSPDGARLFCGREDGEIHCFDAHTVESVGTPWIPHDDGIRALSFSPDGKRLASAGGDGTVRCWDVESGNPVGEPLRHDWPLDVNGAVVRFSPSGEYLAFGFWLKPLLIWRVPWWDDGDGKTIHPLLDMSAVVSSDGRSNTPDLDFLDISAPRRPLPLQDCSRANPPRDPPRVQSSVSSRQWWRRIPRLVFYRVHPIYPGFAPPRTYVASRETVDTTNSPSSPAQMMPSSPEVLTRVAESSSGSEGSTDTPTADVEPEVSQVGCCGLLSRRRPRTTATGARRDTAPVEQSSSSRPARTHPSDSNNAAVAVPASTRSATQDILELSAVVS